MLCYQGDTGDEPMTERIFHGEQIVAGLQKSFVISNEPVRARQQREQR